LPFDTIQLGRHAHRRRPPPLSQGRDRRRRLFPEPHAPAGRPRPDERIFPLLSSWDRFAAEKVPPFAHVRFRDLRIPVRAVNYLWQTWRWPTLDAVFGVRLDLTHSPTPLLLPTRGRKVVTVYDLFFLDEPEKADREARRVFSRSIGRSLADADGVLTISEFTRRALLTRFPLDERKVRATRLGLGAIFREEPAEEALAARRTALALPERFLLFVGAIEPARTCRIC
jgi:hypothetical protein